MKVLVTGATGFIGNYVVKDLLKNNHKVIATSVNKEKAKTFSWYNEVEYLSLDLSQIEKDFNYFQFFKNPEKVIHLAWEGLPNYQSLFHFEENLFHHYAFLKDLVSDGATDITISGTCMEYGLQEGMLNEEMASLPANPYAIAKDTLRKFLEQLQKNYSFSLKWARLFYMFGNGQNTNALLPQLEKALENGDREFNMSGGEQKRDYLYVGQVAEYIVKIALQNEITGIINCCSNNPVTISKLVENFLAERKQSIKLNKGFFPYPDYEPMHFWGDNKKLKRILEKGV
jgi:dTDP-6-deoxy-L-talose 4-dehydrogenase (NAD+)